VSRSQGALEILQLEPISNGLLHVGGTKLVGGGTKIQGVKQSL